MICYEGPVFFPMIVWNIYGCFQKQGDFTPKMDGENNGRTY